jgi:hypothetical protein
MGEDSISAIPATNAARRTLLHHLSLTMRACAACIPCERERRRLGLAATSGFAVSKYPAKGFVVVAESHGLAQEKSGTPFVVSVMVSLSAAQAAAAYSLAAACILWSADSRALADMKATT